jgi:hypothetical protein
MLLADLYLTLVYVSERKRENFQAISINIHHLFLSPLTVQALQTLYDGFITHKIAWEQVASHMYSFFLINSEAREAKQC